MLPEKWVFLILLDCCTCKEGGNLGCWPFLKGLDAFLLMVLSLSATKFATISRKVFGSSFFQPFWWSKSRCFLRSFFKEDILNPISLVNKVALFTHQSWQAAFEIRWYVEAGSLRPEISGQNKKQAPWVLFEGGRFLELGGYYIKVTS